MPYYVQLIECERGWSQKVDETLTFGEDENAAREYVREFNSENTAAKAPDWYMYATGPTWSDHLIRSATDGFAARAALENAKSPAEAGPSGKE